MKTVSYASYCCAKDRERSKENHVAHMESHSFKFDEVFQVFQRCEPFALDPRFYPIIISEFAYPEIMASKGIPFPDPVMDELTHGWGGPHYYAHHLVNLIESARQATSEYLVLADGDCYMKDQPAGESWITKGIEILENDKRVFVVSPNEGGSERFEDIMSQQMFLVNRQAFVDMPFIPWDGKYIEGGPFREYYALMEGVVHRHMKSNELFRYVLGPEYHYYHLQWH